MARIDGASRHQAGLLGRFAYWLSKRRLGKVPEPLAVAALHRWILRGYVGYEFALDRSRLVDPRLKALASLKVATLIGCLF